MLYFHSIEQIVNISPGTFSVLNVLRLGTLMKELCGKTTVVTMCKISEKFELNYTVFIMYS
uniref:Uncharacterized protein n=1 Tax=Anguilla anguilla TaxID=7936 RepID=A0A0E9RYE6_ANGAN